MPDPFEPLLKWLPGWRGSSTFAEKAAAAAGATDGAPKGPPDVWHAAAAIAVLGGLAFFVLAGSRSS